MPNHCSNRIEISGEPKDVKIVKKFLKSEERIFDINNIRPMPKELEDTNSPTREPDSFESRRLRKLYGVDNWYEWTKNKWGTKWNSYNIEIDNEDDEFIVYKFDTAWSPPEPVIFALRNKFPDVGITAFFDEPGMEIAGYY